MTRPTLLDLFCCQGGAAKGYHDAGFDVIGVDIAPQPRYPYDMAVGDALALLRQLLDGRTHPVLGYGLGDIDAIHASPPCQSFTAYRRKGQGVGDGYLNLIPETRELLDHTGLPYVIENVEQAKSELRDPVRYCGSSFGLDVRRHRLFESNVPLMPAPCDHSWQTPRFPPATNRTNLRSTVEVGVWRIPLEVQQRAMGIDWMDLKGLSQAIPPAYSRHVGEQLMRHLDAEHEINTEVATALGGQQRQGDELMSETTSGAYDTHIEGVIVGEQAIIEIEAAYRDGIDPNVLVKTHHDIATAIEYHLNKGTVSKP